jgi:hypothetical protein
MYQKFNFVCMYNQGSYLRVLTPRVTNGTNLQILPNGTIDYKEAHLPISAKRKMEEYNRKLPSHLKKVLEVVEGNTQPVVAQPQAAEVNNDLLAQLDHYKAKMEQMEKAIEALLAANKKLQDNGSVPGNRKEASDGNASKENVATTIKPQPIK